MSGTTGFLLGLWPPEWASPGEHVSGFMACASAARIVVIFSCVQLFVTHGLQHARFPCPPLSPRVCSNSCPFESMMPSNHLILCYPFLLLPSIFPSISLFQWVCSSHQVAKVLKLQHQSFQWIFSSGFWPNCLPNCRFFFFPALF